jgi:hypothetical protein
VEHECSLPHLQEPATCPYPESDQSSPFPHDISWSFILILSYHIIPGLPSGLFSSGFPTQILYAPLQSTIRATCPAQLNLLNLITQIIFGKAYRLLSSCYLVPLRLKYLLQHPILEHPQLHSSLNATDHGSHPHTIVNVPQHGNYLWRGVVSTSPHTQAAGPPRAGCPRLRIKYIRSYPPYWRPFLYH